MRTAAEMDFQVLPIDGLEFVTDKVGEVLAKIRTVSEDSKLAVRIFIEVEEV